MVDNIKFDTKLVGEVEGDFYIDSYQRGYRWGKEEVRRLLEDIYANGTNHYCLQPIVVKRIKDQFELIDGQQRLTTIYLIYQYMHNKVPTLYGEPKFSIYYKTREETRKFLQKIELEKKNENIDFYFIADAYETISNWFDHNKQTVLTKFAEYLDDNVKFIWYEVDETVKSIPLFTRLNIGKIPLTSSELVKAMFLSRDIKDNEIIQKQEEIALQWDNIEKELHDERLWYFLTNEDKNNYQTRIDLILDLIAQKPVNCKDKYYTYFEIERKKEEQANQLVDIWNDIQHTFLLLKDWFINHELYHKIGYLITSNVLTLEEIFEISKGKAKDKFAKCLDEEIRKSIEVKSPYSEYSYSKHPEIILRLLKLFNIESVRQNGEHTQWFPFDKFKSRNGGKIVWSLEHIHAQHSDNLDKEAQWKEWLKLHLKSIKIVESDNDELTKKIEEAISKQPLGGTTFRDLQKIIVEKLTEKNILYDTDTIANLALLNFVDNAALNNSTFDVKRDKIIEKDQNGEYIPFCTRMVFLKYYTSSEDNQIHFWGQKDMEAYINKINEVLSDYLGQNVIKYRIGEDRYE